MRALRPELGAAGLLGLLATGGCGVPLAHYGDGPLAVTSQDASESHDSIDSGLYRFDDGCYLANLPASESFPDGQQVAAAAEGSSAGEDGPLDDAGGWLAALAALLLLAEGLLAGRSWRPAEVAS